MFPETVFYLILLVPASIILAACMFVMFVIPPSDEECEEMGINVHGQGR